MKLSSLIPEDCFGTDQMIFKMMHRMAEKIDYLEAIIKAQKEDIAEREAVLDVLRGKAKMDDEYINIGSVMSWDPGYKIVKTYFGGAEDE